MLLSTPPKTTQTRNLRDEDQTVMIFKELLIDIKKEKEVETQSSSHNILSYSHRHLFSMRLACEYK